MIQSCVVLVDTDRTLIYTWKCFAILSCLRRASQSILSQSSVNECRDRFDLQILNFNLRVEPERVEVVEKEI